MPAATGRPGMGRWDGMMADDGLLFFPSLSRTANSRKSPSVRLSVRHRRRRHKVDRPLSPFDCAAAFCRSTQNRRKALSPAFAAAFRSLARSLARRTFRRRVSTAGERARVAERAVYVMKEARASHGEDTIICQESATLFG